MNWITLVLLNIFVAMWAKLHVDEKARGIEARGTTCTDEKQQAERTWARGLKGGSVRRRGRMESEITDNPQHMSVFVYEAYKTHYYLEIIKLNLKLFRIWNNNSGQINCWLNPLHY